MAHRKKNKPRKQPKRIRCCVCGKMVRVAPSGYVAPHIVSKGVQCYPGSCMKWQGHERKNSERSDKVEENE